MLIYVPRHCCHHFFRLYPLYQNQSLLHLLHAHGLLRLGPQPLHVAEMPASQFKSITEALASDFDVSPHLHTSSHIHYAQASAPATVFVPASYPLHSHIRAYHNSYSHDKTADSMPAMHKKLSLSSVTFWSLIHCQCEEGQLDALEEGFFTTSCCATFSKQMASGRCPFGI